MSDNKIDANHSEKDETFKSKMTIIEGACWKCEQPMKVTFTENEWSMSNNCQPDEFSEVELAFARGKGVLIEMCNSKTAGFSYLANTCPHCKSFVGGHYLFTQYIQPADIEELKSTVYEVGYILQ